MSSIVRLALVLHNHQPIGNFDGVIEQAYQDSYKPFLDVFEPYDKIRIGLHTSGPLMLWLAEKKPDYLDRIRALVDAGRIEILGGPFYEPILTMLPSRDRIGQIQKYSAWLSEQFRTPINGMWTPERVWESQLVRDIVPSGIRYTILDDFHFRAAGYASESLTNYFVTEDDGYTLRVFPGNERLRYIIPFAPVHEVIDYCRTFAAANPGGSLVFGDDGEKFGTWPNTKAHVYEQGWLRRFFDQLSENSDWLLTCGPSEIIRQSAPVGRVFLPDCSYREMTEWALPVEQQLTYDEITKELENDSRWPKISRFMRGGLWRNFRVKYSEANEMYCRMLEVSRKLERSRREPNIDQSLLPTAENHLYRGQCNCPYWHGAFGGIYLPHLRNATYSELIQADNLLERASGRIAPWVDAASEDFDKDTYPEVRLSNDKLIAYLAPYRGGMIYELDMRHNNHNLLAGIQRRPENYHQAIKHGATEHARDAASIHDRIVFKQSGLDQRLHYDKHPRKAMIDRFFDNDVDLEAIVHSQAMERGDFVNQPYEAKIRRGTEKIQIHMRRDGNAWGIPLTITKAVTISSGADVLQVAYLIEGLPPNETFHFATEWNWAGLPAGTDDRFFFDDATCRMGHLGTRLDLHDKRFFGMIDQWLGVSVQYTINRPTSIWAYPVETVSQSEGGYEAVHQCVCVMPHWWITGDSEGKWSVAMNLVLASQHEPKPRLAPAQTVTI